MKISGFSMGKNALKLYYPMRQSVESILPLVDEFVVALGDSDEDDITRSEIEAIGSDKIRIVDTVWDIEKYPRGMEHAHQTDIAKDLCSGDWLFYLQSDEVVHERDLEKIRLRCEELLDDHEVEGLLFRYRHFWGDYEHVQDGHCWYRKEIRIVRNNSQIHSWESAQSFRRIPGFDGVNYRQQAGTYKLKVADVDAEIFHYGWVRPPRLMQNKIKIGIEQIIVRKEPVVVLGKTVVFQDQPVIEGRISRISGICQLFLYQGEVVIPGAYLILCLFELRYQPGGIYPGGLCDGVNASRLLPCRIHQ